MAGYPGTPLAVKLGFTEGMRVVLHSAPPNYGYLVAPVPNGVRFTTGLSSGMEMVHIFATKLRRLDSVLRSAVPKLKPDGIIWVSSPKKASKQPTDITEDTVREVALPLGLVDINVCAVDAVWSGLKLVIRRTRRESGRPAGPVAGHGEPRHRRD